MRMNMHGPEAHHLIPDQAMLIVTKGRRPGTILGAGSWRPYRIVPPPYRTMQHLLTILYRPSPTPYRIPYRHRPRRGNMHMCMVPVTCIRRDLLLTASLALLIKRIPLGCMLHRYQYPV